VALLGGLVFGLALLTKIQAVLLTVPVAVWAMAVLGRRAVAFVAIWGLTGAALLFAGWPWMWSSTFDHLRGYLGRATERATLYVWYLGQTWADRDVPWHYPWVMFLATVPVGLHLLGGVGAAAQARSWRSSRREWLVAACGLFPLVVFSVPGIAAYDGERLFSVVFPLWAIFVGRGAAAAREWGATRVSRRYASIALAVFMASQSIGLVAMRPSWLSYYNATVGGLAGAQRMGFSVTYWGDGLTRSFLADVAQQVPLGATLLAAPTLHHAQWPTLLRHSPRLLEREVTLVPYETGRRNDRQYLIVFPRTEYLPEELRTWTARATPLVAVRRSGVLLAGLYQLDSNDPAGRSPPAAQHGRDSGE
jgi:hypothetical protein